MAIITISRGSFAGGNALAQCLAQRLGFPALSREQLLQQTARDFGISEKELSGALDATPPFWQQMPGKRLAYVKAVTAVLLEHVRAGKLIYHGYVGHLLLSGIDTVLRVRLIADMEYRIRAAMDAMKLSREAAIAHIQKMDKARSSWARFLYGVDWEDPSQYDLVLHIGRVTVEGACKTVTMMSELEEFAPSAESQKRLEDLSLSCRVWAALAKDKQTRSAAINVTADAGQIVLAGAVGSNKSIEQISQIAAGVEGVKDVRSELTVGADWYW